MRILRILGATMACAALAGVGGCIGQLGDERNPFLTATETYGASLFESEDQEGQGGGAAADTTFRQTMTVTLANNVADAELNVRFAAWVKSSSIRSAEQQDALLADGYVQLTREVALGTAFALTPGTFVYNGPGIAGATAIRLPPTGATEENEAEPTIYTFELMTPDVILLFMEPPVSCESVAFNFTLDGDPIDETYNGGGVRGSGRRTLAQVDVYECNPFDPGLFFKSGGGAREPNEYFEGQDIWVDFSQVLNPDGHAAIVTIGIGAAQGETP